MYAAINSDGYNVVLLFHLLTVIIGTGSAFVVQFINAKDSDILKTASIQRIVWVPYRTISLSRRRIRRRTRGINR